MIEIETMLRRVVNHLDSVGIPYMVVGSLASSALGVARTTYDANVMIAPTIEQLETFLGRTESEYYFDRNTARKAFQNRSMFNVIDYELGCKADLIFVTDQPFHHAEFNRRCMTPMPNSELEVWTATAEDTILSKLWWSKLGGSQRQYQDAGEVARVQRANLDHSYLRKWAVELGVEDLLDKMLDEVGLSHRPS